MSNFKILNVLFLFHDSLHFVTQVLFYPRRQLLLCNICHTNPGNLAVKWGAVLDTTTGEYYGKNIMGRLLMELREKKYLEYNKFEF